MKVTQYGEKLLIQSLANTEFIQGPILVNLATITFWKRKDSSSTPEQHRIIPLPPLQAPSLPQLHSTSKEEANKAKEALKVLLLEKQILASAITTIFESEGKGVISQTERDRMVEKYKVDLKRLEKTVDGHQRIVDLNDLENARDELIKNFELRMTEVETKIQNLKSGNHPLIQRAPQVTQLAATVKVTEAPIATTPVSHADTEITDAEKRIDQIRAEILQAMDRLEQIETEG